MQNHVIDAAFGVDADSAYAQSFHKDSITELFFEDVPGLIRTFSDPYTQQTVGLMQRTSLTFPSSSLN